MGVRTLSTRALRDLPVRPSRLTSKLPADEYTTGDNVSDSMLRVSRPVSKAAFSYIRPESAPDPTLLAVSPAAVRALDLDPDAPSTDEFLQVFSGNQLLENTRPWALCYAGHQFG